MSQLRILITGSNSGFGLLASLTLARQGHHVIATMRDLNKGTELQEAAEAEGLSIEMRVLDVCDAASVDAALSDAETLDVLINNAGFEVQGGLEMVDDGLMQKQLDTNVIGPLRTIRAVMPAWRKRGSGVIVNVGSAVGIVASPYGGAYSASKFAIEGMTEALYMEAKPDGIRVHIIEPGRFSTTNFGSNIIRPEGWVGSELETRQLAFREALSNLDGKAPPNPQDVADAIVKAATDASTPLRTLVGDDAVMLATAYRSAEKYEDFEAMIRQRLNWHI
jgi:NAD(P)-dependent dehydrogenase (short-subunit alcohol dehydrogenase family)